MTAIDWIIVALVLFMAAQGYRQGFIVGALSFAGFVGGAIVGTRLGPKLLTGGSSSPYAPLFGLLGAAIGGTILATGLQGAAITLRRRLRLPGLETVDGALGGLLGAALALGMVWIAGAVALQTPGARQLRRDIQRSAILRHLNDALPPSGAILHALARFDPFPTVNGPGANVPPPRAAIARDPQVRAAAPSVVRVLGTACGLGIEGSGWVAAPGVVVTNAHVVAGEDDTTVQDQGDGPKLPAQAIVFDPHNDIAVLRVGGLHAPALRFGADPASGTLAAVLGFPLDGPYDVSPARLGPTRTVITQDAYGRGPVTRLVESLRGVVRHGNSGGPVVDADGAVVGTVFAATRSGRTHGGFAVPDAVVRDALARAHGTVGTGPCAG
jgi:S1-C subfamily serine protease